MTSTHQRFVLLVALLSWAVLGCQKRNFNTAETSDPNLFQQSRLKQRPSYKKWGEPAVRCHQDFKHQEVFFDASAKTFHFCSLDSREGWEPDQETCEELLPVAGRWGFTKERSNDSGKSDYTHYQFVKPKGFVPQSPQFLFVVTKNGKSTSALYDAAKFQDYKMNEADCGTMLGFERKFESSVFKAETDQDVAKWHTCAQGESCGE